VKVFWVSELSAHIAVAKFDVEWISRGVGDPIPVVVNGENTGIVKETFLG
jgi:hypothetical protein